MSREELIGILTEEAKEQMEKAVAHTRTEFASVRTGRASPALVEKLPVDYYGSTVPLQQLAGFSVPEARQLLISPYDKNAMTAIEKAIQDANLGLNPSNDGNAIRLSFPVLTEERRKEYVRMVKQMAEDGRNSVRGARREARKELERLEKGHEISADDLHWAESELDKLTKDEEAKIEEALEHKTQELLED